jgi:predicted GIY-YIG superfamily endonuclease
MLPTKFRFILPNGFRGEEFKKSANQKQESPVADMFANGSGRNEQRTFHRCFLSSVGSFCQAISEEKNFKNQPIRNKSRLWQPCLLTDRNEMSSLYRGSSIDASYQVSVHLTKQFQRRFLKIGQSETRIACGGHICKWIGTK